MDTQTAHETETKVREPAAHETHDSIPHDLPRISGRKLFIIGMIALLVFVAAFFARFFPQMAHERNLRQEADNTGDAAPIVDVALPQPLAVEEELKLPANVQPKQQTAIYARVDGYLHHWNVDIQDHVEKGQLLAEIEAPDTDAQLAEAQAQFLLAQANVVKAQSDLQLANSTYDRYHGLLATGSVTQQDLDTRQSNAAQAAASKAAADASVKSAQATVDQLLAQQGFEKITAPFSGTITFRNYDVGARISASDTAPGHELFDIADTDQLRIYVSVPQAYVTNIQMNQPVQFLSVRNYGERPFKGFVARTAGALDPATRTLLTELDFDNSDHLLWAGMYGEVRIGIHHDHPTLTVPTAAMLFESSGTQLAVVDSDNHVHFRKVTVGQDLGQRLEVISGLSNDERVVTNPGEKLADGIAVEVAAKDQPKTAVADAQPAPPSAQPTTAPSLSVPTPRVAASDFDPPSPSGAGGANR